MSKLDKNKNKKNENFGMLVRKVEMADSKRK